MNIRTLIRYKAVRAVAVTTLAVVVGAFAASCSRSEPLSQADVADAIADALADSSAAGVTAEEVEAAIAGALNQVPSIGEVTAVISDAIAKLQAAQLASGSQSDVDWSAPPAPAKADPSAYTRYFVDAAIARYEAVGLEATLAHYNDSDSVDGQWYVFIIDRNADVIGHYDPARLGLNLRGFAGTDINGYEFGSQMLAADETGRWVPYVYANPITGTLDDVATFELKNAWVVRHDGLLFGSGWYVDTERLLPDLISESLEHFRSGGIEAMLEFYNDPHGISAGLIPAVAYYNSTDVLGGSFSGFSAGPDGTILSHFDPEVIGSDIEDLLGPAVHKATSAGAWITAADNPEGAGPETMRVWVADVDGTLIGGGWYSN